MGRIPGIPEFQTRIWGSEDPFENVREIDIRNQMNWNCPKHIHLMMILSSLTSASSQELIIWILRECYFLGFQIINFRGFKIVFFVGRVQASFILGGKSHHWYSLGCSAAAHGRVTGLTQPRNITILVVSVTG